MIREVEFQTVTLAMRIEMLDDMPNLRIMNLLFPNFMFILLFVIMNGPMSFIM